MMLLLQLLSISSLVATAATVAAVAAAVAMVVVVVAAAASVVSSSASLWVVQTASYSRSPALQALAVRFPSCCLLVVLVPGCSFATAANDSKG
jgi:hypothetical protein